ncbi:MAG TPA: hypothetical protein VF844_23495 [Ktedonobacteraceae bacterium]
MERRPQQGEDKTAAATTPPGRGQAIAPTMPAIRLAANDRGNAQGEMGRRPQHGEGQKQSL